MNENSLLDSESRKRYEEVVKKNKSLDLFGMGGEMIEEKFWELFIDSEYKSRLEKSIEEEELKLFNITKELKILDIKKEIYSKFSIQFKEFCSYVEGLIGGLETEYSELEALLYNVKCELSILQSELRVLNEYIATHREETSSFIERFLSSKVQIPNIDFSSNSSLDIDDDDEPYDPYYHSEAYINDGWN